MFFVIEEIRQKVAHGLWEFSLHATRQAIARGVQSAEVAEAIQAGEVVENYPNDKYGPTCLVSGWTAAGRALHIQCSHPSRPLVKIVTLYEPDPAEWDETLRHRK